VEREEAIGASDFCHSELRFPAPEFRGVAVVLDKKAFDIAAMDPDGEHVQNLAGTKLSMKSVSRPIGRRRFRGTHGSLAQSSLVNHRERFRSGFSSKHDECMSPKPEMHN
jgi:hypothetical protein